MSFRLRCRRCDGRGYYYPYKHRTCETCGGDQEITLPGKPADYRDCNRCDGRGFYYPYPHRGCGTCAGRGVLRKKPVKAAKNDIRKLDLHPEILEASQDLYRSGHYSQSVFEACKVLIEKVQKKSGRGDLDGAKLMFKVLSPDNPTIAFNRLRTKSDLSEQEGLLHICVGTALAIRNPRGHRSRVVDTPERARELLSTLSYLAKRIDEGRRLRGLSPSIALRRSATNKTLK